MSQPTETEINDRVRVAIESATNPIGIAGMLDRQTMYQLLWQQGVRLPADTSAAGLLRELRRLARLELESR